MAKQKNVTPNLAPIVPVSDFVSYKDNVSVIISQQALNLARQIVAAQGWAKTILDIYTGGKLLAETLPALDPLDWILTNEQLSKLSPDARAAYLEKDAAWGTKQVSVTVTSIERSAIERAFQHFAATAASAKQLGPNQYLLELIVAFSIKDAPAEDNGKA